MKILSTFLYFLITCILCFSVYLFTGYRDSEEVKDETPVVMSYTVSPKLPSTVQFCGKDIDVSRYNIREGLDRELSSFTYLHSTTMLLIKRANRYFPVIEPILKANGIPDDFK